jgi:hypothetical protein
MKGERGETGEVGKAGSPGERGLPGERGERGSQGLLNKVMPYVAGSITYDSNCVLYNGATWQALRDTASSPDSKSEDWQLLAAAGLPGQGLTIRGTYDASVSYHALDVVTLDHGWFVARCNSPGSCPGPDWQSGPTGKRGEKGLPGDRGARGRDGLQIADIKFDFNNLALVTLMSDGTEGPQLVLSQLLGGIKIDRANYAIVLMRSDGSEGLRVSVRELFEQYETERRGGR